MYLHLNPASLFVDWGLWGVNPDIGRKGPRILDFPAQSHGREALLLSHMNAKVLSSDLQGI
jgi:hypothetical protein